MSDIEQTAAQRAYEAGLGVSEWQAFLTPEEALTLLCAARSENEALRQRLAEGENEALRTQLQFISDRIEDNAEACSRDPTERGWRATFTYEETVELRCLVDPAYAQQIQEARVGARGERA